MMHDGPFGRINIRTDRGLRPGEWKLVVENNEEVPHVCPKCDGMTTLSGRHPYLFPTDTVCPTCGGTGVVWRFA